MVKETFKDIPGYEGRYQVSDCGRVKSLLGKGKKILTPSLNPKGYMQTSLTKGGKSKTCQIHKLVAMAFLGHQPNRFNAIIDHIDNDRKNNNVSNLQITSVRNNTSKDAANETGYVGVRYQPQNRPENPYVARIRSGKKHIHIGDYETAYDAHLAYLNAYEQIQKHGVYNEDKIKENAQLPQQ